MFPSYFKNIFCFTIFIILPSSLEKEPVVKILTNSISNIEFIPDWQTLIFSREMVYLESLFNYCFNKTTLLLEHFTFISHFNSLLIAQILFFIIIILFSNSNILFFSRIGRNSFFNFGLITLVSIIENNFL